MLGSIGRDLALTTLDSGSDCPELDPDIPCRFSELGEDRQDLLRACVGGEIEIGVLPPATQHRVTDRTPNQGDREPVLSKTPPQ